MFNPTLKSQLFHIFVSVSKNVLVKALVYQRLKNFPHPNTMARHQTEHVEYSRVIYFGYIQIFSITNSFFVLFLVLIIVLFVGKFSKIIIQ